MESIKNKNLYYIGGYVRDELLNIPNFDVDFCYEGNAIEYSKDFNIIRINPDFGTVKINIGGKNIDIASTRCEIYPKPGHLPVVKSIGCSLKEDLIRRDFTINALAKNTLTNEIIDYFSGREDLKNKIIRVLHDNSFIDDPSRIIRALKFSVRLGFELDKHTKELQENYLDNINYDVSYHRLKKELKETFNLNKVIAYQRFIEQGIYKLLGENQTVPTIIENIESFVSKYKPENVWLVYLGAFNLTNFELTSEEENIIDNYNKIKKQIPNNNYEIYKLFCNIPLESILLYALTINSTIARKYLDELSHIKIEINGNDLKNLGITPNKQYKQIFDFLLKKKLENPDTNKSDEIIWIGEEFL